MEKLSIIEDKLKALMDEFNMKNTNLASITSDIGKYQNAKEVLQNDLHILNGAIQAYRATVDLFKGTTQPSDPGQTPSG